MSEDRGYLEAQKIEIHYTPARFHRRVLGNLIDFVITAILFFALFLGIRGVVTNPPDYRVKDDRLTSIRLDTKMYMAYPSGKLADVVSFIDDSTNNYSGYAKMDIALDSINTFINYLNDNIGESAAKTVEKSFDEYRLSDDMTYMGTSMFIEEEGQIIRNPSCKAIAEQYYSLCYAPFIDAKCQGFLITLIPEYLELTRYESNILIYGEILPSYLIAPIFAYLLPMLIIRRGRMTLGKAMYRVGTVDSRLLNPTWKRTLARFLILYLLEYCLSPFTFAIPFLVSASLMGFSKNKQGLPDYLLGLREIDTTNAKIYHSREEIALDGVGTSKKPVDFKAEYDD